MPAKFRVKHYSPNGIYHIYNRGLDGREVFVDQQDFVHMETLMQRYLNDKTDEVKTGYKQMSRSVLSRRKEMNLANEILLIAYCLMPDHLHFVVKQSTAEGITRFMRRLMTGYVMYYNLRYKRRGPLFEMAYRAVEIDNKDQLEHLTRMVHLNPVVRTVRRFGPVETVSSTPAEEYIYSSYSDYIGEKPRNWIKKDFVNFERFKYKSFVEDARINSDEVLGELKID